MSAHGLLRRAARWVRRILLPSLDLLLLERRRLLRFVEPGGSVLDAGCGDGTCSFLLHRRGCRVTGVTNDAEAVEALRSRRDEMAVPEEQLVFLEHDLRRGAPPGAPFDAVVCFDVLEHILDDRAALAALAGSLRQGGRLLLTVPDSAAPPLWGDTVAATEDGGHVRQGYTRAALDALFDGAGLVPVRWVGFGGFFAQKATNVSRRLERRTGSLFVGLRVLWLALLRPLCRLDGLLPWPSYGLFVLAQRKR